jgi:uncharacterized membrane protein HdeD (DUF308 family)
MRYLVRLLDQALLFVLGAATIPLTDWLLRNTELPYSWRIGGPFIALGVACCFLEVLAIRHTGRHRWFGSWLPAVLGVLAPIVVGLMLWPAHYPDHATSGDPGTGLAVFSFLIVGVPIFAVAVNVTAALAACLSGPLPPQARFQMLEVLGRHWWLPAARAAAAALTGAGMFASLDLDVSAVAAYAIAEGMLAITVATLNQDRSEARWWPARAGVIGISAGILTLLWPLVVPILVILIAIWSLTTGLFQIVDTNRWRGALENDRLIRFGGAVSLFLGAVSVHVLPKLIA